VPGRMSASASHHTAALAAARAEQLRQRKNVELLRPEQLSALRDAFARVMQISERAVIDNRGYQYFAGLHGLPGQYCRHGNPPGSDPLFLPWHRAYLYFFELALRDQVATATLSWWDWTSPASHRAGIPAAFADEQVVGTPNPLSKAPVQPAARRNGQPKETFRQPGQPTGLPSAAQVQTILSVRSFSDFTTQIEDVHNAVHGWTGGTMGIIPWAAYDPIFWAHHGNIDRLWRIWQLRHPQNFPASFLGRALPPFPLTVAQTLNIKTLGYDYASTTSSVGGTRA
jgi:tyrosinase